MSRGTTTNSEAYQLYLKGRFYWNQRTKENVRRSIDSFQQAITLDPNYALAYAGLAHAYTVASGYDTMSSKEADPLAEVAAKRAVELAPDLGIAHAALASAKAAQHDWAAAEQEFQTAMRLDAKDASIPYFYSYSVLVPEARYEEAVRYMQRALGLEPESLAINANLGGTLTMARRYAEAKAQLDHALAMEPNFTIAHARLTDWYQIQGQYEEARQISLLYNPEFAGFSAKSGKTAYWRGVLEATRLRTQSSAETSADREFQAIAWAQLGDRQKALDSLEKSLAEGDDLLPNQIRSPLLDPLHGDPRYVAVLRKLNLNP